MNNRPILLVSSTSWTEDEDFNLLLTALVLYDTICKEMKSLNQFLPNVHCIITGKGPLKAFYEDKIKEFNMIFVKIETMWLPAEDYPKLLGKKISLFLSFLFSLLFHQHFFLNHLLFFKWLNRFCRSWCITSFIIIES